MANDQNKSNKGPQNSFASVGEESLPLTALNALRKAESLQSHQGYQQTIQQLGNIENDPIFQTGRQFPGQFKGTNLGDTFDRLDARHSSLTRRQEIMESGSQARAISSITSTINRAFSDSSLNGQSTAAVRDPQIQQRVLQNARNLSPANVHSQLSASDERLKGYERSLHGIASDNLVSRFSEVDPEAKGQMNAFFQQKDEEIRNRAMLYGVQKAHKALGMDAQSVDISRLRTEVSAEASMGGKGSAEAKAFIDALKELRKETDVTTKEFERLTANVDKAQKEFENIGGGGGGATARFNYYGGAFGAVGAAAQQMLVGQRMQEVANISGSAGLANQQYDLYKAARGGDVASQLALGQIGAASDFGAEMKQGTLMSQSLQMAGLGMDTAAGWSMMTEAAAQKANPISYGLGISTQNTTTALAGAGQFIGASASGLALGTDMLGTNGKGEPISATAARLQGIQAHNQAVRSINYVGATQAQGLRDFYTGLDTVSQNMGTGSEAFLSGATSNANLEAMQKARMSPEQWAKAADLGVNSMGSTFDTNQIFGARNLEAKGFGSVDKNLQRMGSLASAGANNPQASMETVLSAAVASGLDKSKGLDLLVQNTAAMAGASIGAAIGVDTTGAATAMITSAMDPGMVNRENALKQAMSAQEVLRQSTTNQSVSFIGMANTGMLSDKLLSAGIDVAGKGGSMAMAMSNLQGMDVQTLKEIQAISKKDPQKAARLFQDQGVNSNESNVGQLLDITLKEKTAQTTRRSEASMNISHDEVERLRAKEKAGTLTGDERTVLGQVFKGEGFVSGSAGARAVEGINAPNTMPTKGKDLTSDKVTGDLKTQLDLLRTSGFQQLTEAASTASIQLGGFNKALKTFTDLQMKFEKGGMDTEKTFTTAASTMAKDFSGVAKLFTGATTKYEKASEEMIKAAQLINHKLSLPAGLKSMLDEQK